VRLREDAKSGGTQLCARADITGTDDITYEIKRLLIHVAGMNLGLLLRNLYGSGTPRSLQGLSFTLRFWAAMVAYTLDSEKPQLFGARVTSQHFVPPYYHPRTCVHFRRSEIQKRTLTPDC